MTLLKRALVCAAVCLACLVRAGLADEVRTYDVTVPAEWKGQLAVGKVSLVGEPFYGGAHPFFGFSPVARVSYSLTNLTSDPLYVLVDYRSESKGFGRNAQTQVCYALAPHEERQIDALAPVAWEHVSATFFIRMQPYQRPSTSDDGVPQHRVVTIDPLPAFQFPTADVSVTVENNHFTVDSVRLAHSQERGNVLVIEASNESDRELPLGIYVAVSDPGTRGRADSGHFFESVRPVPAHSQAAITVPYSIPGAGPDPLLAFTIFEPPSGYLPAEELRGDRETFRSHFKSNYDLTLISYGLLNLRRAADRGECVLPDFVPVEERAKLTAQAKSEHFVFHYRPGSFADEHFQTAIKVREEAYARLSTTLKMDLPAPVRIDLYPDMAAKGLGSGTTWTPANTVSSLHIAEVYSQTTRIDPNHELAHIFSYHFPGHADLGGEQHAPGRGLVEGFADYFEAHADPAQARQAARSMLRSGNLAPLAQLLVSSSPTSEHEALIEFLLKKDVEKFKQFYVRVTAKPTPEDVEAASKEIYGKCLDELEAEWHQSLQGAGDVRSESAARTRQVGPAFEVPEIDPGDRAWGQNVLHVKAKNLSNTEQPFWLHIGGRYQESSRPVGFGMGMGEPIVFGPGEERQIEHPYWVPPQPGKLFFRVKFVTPSGDDPPWEQEPFLTRDYLVTYETPNTRCNELTPISPFIDKEPYMQKFREGARIPPFEHFTSEHFVFYCSPGTPAYRGIEAIEREREAALKTVCDFLGVPFEGKVTFFLFPDAPDKRWCMMHQGHGLAFGTTIAEIYNDEVQVDPTHELTHIVAGQIGSPPALFNEGLAVFMQAGHRWSGEHVDVMAAKLLAEGKLVPIQELLTRTEIGARHDDGQVAYPQSASLVKFIISTYGRARFLELYGQLRNRGDDRTLGSNISLIEKTLGAELATVEADWKAFLNTVEP